MDLEIGERITALRLSRQWTQTHLARQIGTNVKTIKDWENGVSLPTVPNIKKLCELFAITSDYLLNLDSVPTIRLVGMSDADVTRAKLIIQVIIDTAGKEASN